MFSASGGGRAVDNSELDPEAKARQELLAKMAKRSRADEDRDVSTHTRKWLVKSGCAPIAVLAVLGLVTAYWLGENVFKSDGNSAITSGVSPGDLASVQIVGSPSWRITYTNKSDGVLREITYKCAFAAGPGGQTKTTTTRDELTYPLPPGQSDTSPFRYHSGSGGLDLDVAQPRGCEVIGAKFYPEPKEFTYSTIIDGQDLSMRINNPTGHAIHLSKLSLQCVYRLDRSFEDVARYGDVDKSDYTTGEESDVTGRQEGKFDPGVDVPANGAANVLLYYGTGGVRASLPRESGSSDVGGDKYYHCFFTGGAFPMRAIRPLQITSGTTAQQQAPATSASAPAPATPPPTTTTTPPVTPTSVAPNPQAQSAEQPGVSSSATTGESAVTPNPAAQPQTSTPPPGSPERRAIMDAMRPQAEQMVGQPVIFRVISLNVIRRDGVQAWAVVQPLDPQGRPIGPALMGHLYLDEAGWKVQSLERVNG